MNIKETVSHFARSYDQVESIVQALPFAVVLIDQTGLIQYHNELFERVLKIEYKQITHQTLEQFIDTKVIESIKVGSTSQVIINHQSFIVRKEHAEVHGETYVLFLLSLVKQLDPLLYGSGENNELQDVPEQAMKLLKRDEQVIELNHSAEKLITISNAKPIMSLVELIEKTEREALQSALQQTNGNRSKAAKQLGISRTSFYEKLAKYDMS